MRENRVLVLPVNILTVWRANFTWPHYTLPCVLILVKEKYKTQREHTLRNPKRYIPPVSLLLWRKIICLACDHGVNE